jgi:hypothetical protein
MTRTRSPSRIHPTPTETLLTTTFESLVMQLSGSLARGTRLIDQFVWAEPTPQSTMAFELELSALLQEVGRRTMAWALNHLEPEADAEVPSRIECEGHLSSPPQVFPLGGHPLWLDNASTSALRTRWAPRCFHSPHRTALRHRSRPGNACPGRARGPLGDRAFSTGGA